MSDHVLFQMWEPFRESLIAGHLFYVEQARKRLLSQFDDIGAEAEKAAEDWLHRSSCNFDPENDDPGDFYEAANDAGVEFYGLLSEMREHTRLSVVAGMFHEWDKQLREWLVREVRHWHFGDYAALKIWSADFKDIFDLLESLGWKTSGAKFFPLLDACRLAVNVYKHGKGKSFDDLKERYPEYLGGLEELRFDPKYCDHTHLKVSDKQFQEFSEAIVAFWKAIPENTRASEVETIPSWFEKAVLKDRNDEKQTSNG